MQRVTVKNILLVLVAVAVGYLCYLMAAPFLVAISWAAVLAIVVDPLHERLAVRVGRRSVSAAITCVLTVLILLLPLAVIIILVTRSIMGLIDNDQAGMPTDGETISSWVSHEIDIVTRWLDEHFGIGPIGPDTIRDSARTIVEYLVAQTRSLVGGVAGFFFNLVVVIFSLFFFLRDKKAVLLAIRNFLPISDSSVTAVFRRVRDVIWASVIGGGAVAITQGILAGVGLAVIGVPLAPVLGVATSFFSLIPFVGAAGVWIPATIWLLIKGSIGKAIALALWGTFAISLVDNILRPILIGDATRLHTLLIFFAILGGLQVFGFLGLILGPVVLAIGLALIEIFRHEMLESESRVAEREP